MIEHGDRVAQGQAHGGAPFAWCAAAAQGRATVRRDVGGGPGTCPTWNPPSVRPPLGSAGAGGPPEFAFGVGDPCPRVAGTRADTGGFGVDGPRSANGHRPDTAPTRSQLVVVKTALLKRVQVVSGATCIVSGGRR